MATKKTEKPASRALEHGKNAFGAKWLRPGFALTPELDLAFALGHGSAMGPVTLEADLKVGAKAKVTLDSVPRNVAIAVLRQGTNVGMPLPPHEASPAPIDETEATNLLRVRVPQLKLGGVYYRALEAMVGPSCVLPAFLDGLELVEDGAWNGGRLTEVWPVLYGLLLRTPTSESNAARARLEALLAKRRDAFAAAGLDILLHGREAIGRRGYKYSTKYKCYGTSSNPDEPSNVFDLCFCDGDGEWVASQFEALWAVFKFKPQAHMVGPSPARLFFIGGEKALETELKVVSTYPGTKQVEAFASYSELRHPLAVKLVQALATGTSKVKKQADAWLAANA